MRLVTRRGKTMVSKASRATSTISTIPKMTASSLISFSSSVWLFGGIILQAVMGEQRTQLVVCWLHRRRCYPAVGRKVVRLFHEQNARKLLYGSLFRFILRQGKSSPSRLPEQVL